MDLAQAERELAILLSRSQAYGTQVIEDKLAAELAAAFFSVLTPGAICLSNTFPSDHSISWEPVSNATFDAGIVAQVDDKVAGLVFFEDED